MERQKSESVVERYEEKQSTEKLEHLQKPLAQDRPIKEEEVRLLKQIMKNGNELLLEFNKALKMHLQAILRMDQDFQQAGPLITKNLMANRK
uniref:Uncharacterized protein n=1 Tax=Ditylenchus dipsaci TaxID=166011 RepID=A0A915EKY3_9BILA